jgi:hypothetical protein
MQNNVTKSEQLLVLLLLFPFLVVVSSSALISDRVYLRIRSRASEGSGSMLKDRVFGLIVGITRTDLLSCFYSRYLAALFPGSLATR